MRDTLVSEEELVAAGASLRERKKQRTREAIATAAAELFDQVGYEHARTSEIARRAEVGEATLFRHFPNKADLAVERARRAASIMITALGERPASETPYEAILAAATPKTVARVFEGRPERVVRLLRNDEVASRAFFTMLQASDEVALDFARRLQTTPDQRQVRVLANAAVGLVITTVRELVETPKPDTPRTVFVRQAEILRPVLDVRGDRTRLVGAKRKRITKKGESRR